MENEYQKMQRLAGVPVTKTKKQLDENFVGMPMVGNIFDRPKADYELAYEHYLGKLNENEVEEGKIEEGAFGDLLGRMEQNTRLTADVLKVIKLAKEDKEGNADKAVQLMMDNHGMDEEEAIEAVTRIFKKAFEWVGSNELNAEVGADGEENPIDAITMDVPLFIRMLEFAREDASTDMDLHDVVEKATALSAEGEILSMDNYEDLVGGETEELNEGSNNEMENYITGLFDSIDLGDEYEEGPQSYTFEKIEWADEDLYGDEAEMFEQAHEYISSRKTINIKDPKSGTPLTFRTEGENIVVDFNTEDFPSF